MTAPLLDQPVYDQELEDLPSAEGEVICEANFGTCGNAATWTATLRHADGEPCSMTLYCDGCRRLALDWVAKAQAGVGTLHCTRHESPNPTIVWTPL